MLLYSLSESARQAFVRLCRVRWLILCGTGAHRATRGAVRDDHRAVRVKPEAVALPAWFAPGSEPSAALSSAEMLGWGRSPEWQEACVHVMAPDALAQLLRDEPMHTYRCRKRPATSMCGS